MPMTLSTLRILRRPLAASRTLQRALSSTPLSEKLTNVPNQPAQQPPSRFHLLEVKRDTVPEEWKARVKEIEDKGKKPTQPWWQDTERSTFRLLLMDGIVGGVVTPELTEYMTTYPYKDTKWNRMDAVLIARVLLMMDKSDEAWTFLESQFEPTLNELNRAAANSARMGNPTVALSVLDLVKHFKIKPDVVTYTSAIHACARGPYSSVPEALQLLNEMISDNIMPNHRTYGAGVLAHVRLNEWEEVQGLLSSIRFRNLAHKSNVFASAIITCARHRKHWAASQLFSMLLEDGVYPGDKLCNSALAACAKSSDATLLPVIFNLMETHTTPNLYSYNTLISSHATRRDGDEAMKTFEQMQKRGITPDSVTMNALLAAMVRSRDLDGIKHVMELRDELEIPWTSHTLSQLLESCSIDKDVTRADVYWKEALERAIVLDRYNYEALVNVFIESGDYKRALHIWNNSYICRRRARSAKMLNLLLRACAATKDVGMAETLMVKFASRGHVASSVAHNHMLETYIAAGKYHRAKNHLYWMGERKNLASTFGFTLLMKTSYNAKRYDEVRRLFDQYIVTRGHAKRNGDTPQVFLPADALNMFALKAARAKDDHEEVVELYESMPKGFSDTLRQHMLEIVIDSCTKHDDWKSAVSFYDEMTGRLDAEMNVALYDRVIQIVARAGSFDEALDVGGGDWYRKNRMEPDWAY